MSTPSEAPGIAIAPEQPPRQPSGPKTVEEVVEFLKKDPVPIGSKCLFEVKSFVNTVPHPIDIVVEKSTGSQDVMIIDPIAPGKGSVRVAPTQENLGHILYGGSKIAVWSEPTFKTYASGLEDYLDLPAKETPDIIVSAIAADHIPPNFNGRVFVPDTGPSSGCKRNADGILCVTRLYMKKPKTREASDETETRLERDWEVTVEKLKRIMLTRMQLERDLDATVKQLEYIQMQQRKNATDETEMQECN